jgi:hypothetical protein
MLGEIWKAEITVTVLSPWLFDCPWLWAALEVSRVSSSQPPDTGKQKLFDVLCKDMPGKMQRQQIHQSRNKLSLTYSLCFNFPLHFKLRLERTKHRNLEETKVF